MFQVLNQKRSSATNVKKQNAMQNKPNQSQPQKKQLNLSQFLYTPSKKFTFSSVENKDKDSESLVSSTQDETMYPQSIKPQLSLRIERQNERPGMSGRDSPDLDYPSDEENFITSQREHPSLAYPKEYIDCESDGISSSYKDYQEPSEPRCYSVPNHREQTGEPQFKQKFVDSCVQYYDPSPLQKSTSYGRADETDHEFKINQQYSFCSSKRQNFKTQYTNGQQIRTDFNKPPCRILQPHLDEYVQNSQQVKFGNANKHVRENLMQTTINSTRGSFHPLQKIGQNISYADSQKDIFADDDSFTCKSIRDNSIYSTQDTTPSINDDSDPYHEISSQNKDLMYFTDICRVNKNRIAPQDVCGLDELETNQTQVQTINTFGKKEYDNLRDKYLKNHIYQQNKLNNDGNEIDLEDNTFRPLHVQNNQSLSSSFSHKFLTGEQYLPSTYHDFTGNQKLMNSAERFKTTQDIPILMDRPKNKCSREADFLDSASDFNYVSNCRQSPHLGSEIARLCPSGHNNSTGQNTSYLQNLLSRTNANPYESETQTTASRPLYHQSIATHISSFDNESNNVFSSGKNTIIPNKPLCNALSKEANLCESFVTKKDSFVCKSFPKCTNPSRSGDNSFEVDDIFENDDTFEDDNGDINLISEDDNETSSKLDPDISPKMNDFASFPLTPIFSDNSICQKEVVNKSKNFVKPMFCSIGDLKAKPEDVHGKH